MYENHATHSIAGGVSVAAKLHGFRVLSTLKLFPANRKNSPSLPPLVPSWLSRVSHGHRLNRIHGTFYGGYEMDDIPVLWKIYFTPRCLSAVVAEEIARK